MKLMKDLHAEEEKRVKLAAKELYNTLTEKRKELFIIGWQNDPQPKERVKSEIVFDHIVDQAMTGYNWVA